MSDGPRGLLARMYGAAILKAAVYDEVGADPRATAQAAFVVVLASAAAASLDYGLGWLTMAAAGLANLAQWLVWAGITYLVGDKLLGGTATWGQLLRTLGFARGPGILTVFVPLIGGIQIAVQVWVLAAGIVAIRQALGLGTVRALLTAVIGMVPYWIYHTLFLH